jgi:NADPH:quinone reductase-like Zn-dependent oxidoreductase
MERRRKSFGMVAGGSYAEQVVTHQRLVVPVPKELTDVEAAAVPEAFITAHDALVTQGGMKPGDLVLIHAVASGIGSAAVQLVNLWGAKAIGTAGSSDKLKKIEEFASFSPINYKRDNFKKIIEKEFGKNSIDLILDLIGASYWRENIALLKNQGLLILLGLMGGKIVDTDLSLILSKHLHIIGTVLRSRPIEEKISATQSFAHQVIPHLKNKKLKPVIDSVFPFDQLHKATFRMENNENVGKIILTI